MKNWFKITAILLFLFPAVGFLQAGPRTGDDVAAAVASHFHFFQNHFPRYDGSENEEKVFAYIEEKITENRLEYTVRDFSDFADGHSFSKNIEVFIPGEGEDTLLLVVPVNHPAGRDSTASSWNLATGLGYLLYSSRMAELEGKPPMGIRVLFAGGEFAPDSERQVGSELFLESY